MTQKSDYVILGAGIFGLYAAKYLTKKNLTVSIIEKAPTAFTGASYVNQARIHNGYHYPRSFSTAVKAAYYFKRFTQEYDFAILKSFEQIYAISEKFSYTSAADFKKFCAKLDLPCEEIDSSKFFNPGLVEVAFRTQEYAFDAYKIRDFLLAEIKDSGLAEIYYNTKVKHVENTGTIYRLKLDNGTVLETPNILNATYSSINEVNILFGFEPLPLKHEHCEIVLCKVSSPLASVGITVLDGPFFSLMPFGHSGLHSLSAVSYTPIKASATLITAKNNETQWKSMSQMAKKYLLPSLSFTYERSLFTTKTILQRAELDDSRPTIIRHHSQKPSFTSILSGKISSVFDLDQELI